MRKTICSIIIIGGESIKIPKTENPGKAKSFDIKRGRAYFYDDDSGRYKIPGENFEELFFPNYHKSSFTTNYGNPYFA